MSRQMKDSGLPWIREIPETWDVLPNKYVMKKKKTICPLYKGEPILSLTMNGVIVRDLENLTGKRPTTFDGYQRIQKRNLLMCLFDIDVTPRCVGLIKENGLTSPAYSQFCMTEKACANYYYYYYLLLDFTKELLHLAKNLRHSLTEDQLGAIKVPVPSIKEQQRIAGYLDKKCAEIDTLSNSIQQQIDTLEQYKRAVITETVTKGLNPSAPMKDSGIPWIGKVPQHWDLNKLKYVTTKLERGTSPDYTDEELTRVVNQATFSRGFFNDKDIKFSTKPAAGSRGLLKRYDVLLASTGGGVLGKTHFFDEVETYVADGHVTIARANEKKILSKLLYYLFFINFDTFNALMTKGSTNQTELQSLDLANMFIPVPPLSEQQQIVQALDRHTQTIVRAIHSKQQQLEKLEQYKKATIFEYVTGKKQVPEV